MRKDLSHLPEYKQQELDRVVKIICEHATVEMIILFGSHARGDRNNKDWKHHRYVKEDVVYEYSSDFDVLVIVRNKKMEEDFGIWDLIESEIYKKGVRTWVSLLVDNIKYVNEQLELGRYFYSDVKKEGILLYDSGGYKLSGAKRLSSKKQRELAEKDFEYWFESGEHFYDDFRSNLERERFNIAAFNLHQAVERYFSALLLVHTGYRPKTHDLKKLLSKGVDINSDVRSVFFPGIDTKLERAEFELLRKAYVDARYESSYEITEGELYSVGGKVRRLGNIVRGLCKEKIGKF